MRNSMYLLFNNHNFKIHQTTKLSIVKLFKGFFSFHAYYLNNVSQISLDRFKYSFIKQPDQLKQFCYNLNPFTTILRAKILFPLSLSLSKTNSGNPNSR